MTYMLLLNCALKLAEEIILDVKCLLFNNVNNLNNFVFYRIMLSCLLLRILRLVSRGVSENGSQTAFYFCDVFSM